MLFNLSKKVTVVTGAGSGIGRAIAIQFAQQGAQVCLLDLKREAIDAVAKEILNISIIQRKLIHAMSPFKQN
ncbi:MAG: SDR family NAD(P)-dependent oxidoreductase [Cytophagales bacterium]|nr:SDR family NAD(P)-dependent oxidoreductase [Cytophagales bacterium]